MNAVIDIHETRVDAHMQAADEYARAQVIFPLASRDDIRALIRRAFLAGAVYGIDMLDKGAK